MQPCHVDALVSPLAFFVHGFLSAIPHDSFFNDGTGFEAQTGDFNMDGIRNNAEASGITEFTETESTHVASRLFTGNFGQ